jgi:DNA-directed RNA polymerase subunit RPC12/RpoP
MRTKWCDLCENIEATHAEETLCHKCYHRVLYWTKKTPTQMMRRVKNLELYSKTMDAMLGNVKSITRKKKVA